MGMVLTFDWKVVQQVCPTIAQPPTTENNMLRPNSY